MLKQSKNKFKKEPLLVPELLKEAIPVRQIGLNMTPKVKVDMKLITLDVGLAPLGNPRQYIFNL